MHEIDHSSTSNSSRWRKLPTPPPSKSSGVNIHCSDERHVVLREPAAMDIPDWCLIDVPNVKETFGLDNVAQLNQQPASKKPTGIISSGNTTLIGDDMCAMYNKFDPKWLIQVKKGATVQSTGIAIQEGAVVCDRRYVFILLGHNQIVQCERNIVKKLFHGLVDLIRSKNRLAKIFVAALLPSPSKKAKQNIVKFNRSLSEAINARNKTDSRIIFLPVQHAFTEFGRMKSEYFNKDATSLNIQGTMTLTKEMFRLAGFTENK